MNDDIISFISIYVMPILIIYIMKRKMIMSNLKERKSTLFEP